MYLLIISTLITVNLPPLIEKLGIYKNLNMCYLEMDEVYENKKN